MTQQTQFADLKAESLNAIKELETKINSQDEKVILIAYKDKK